VRYVSTRGAAQPKGFTEILLEGLASDGGVRSPLVTAGFVTVAAGLVAIVAAGGWIALAVSCDADPDCDEEEQCREIPAPPGGVPYKQCMPR